jgi:crossover junction endodeoxyribonuclease RusA
MVLSKKGREYKALVQQYVVENNVPKLGDSKLKIMMVLMPRDKRRLDIDNRIKAVFDALEEAGVFNDDFQVDHLEMIRGDIIKGGKIIVVIEEIETPSSPNEKPLVAS